MTRILIVNGNPKTKSFCAAIAKQFEQSASNQGHELKRLDLSTTQFDPNLSGGYDADADIDHSIEQFQQELRWAEHLVLISPVWWGSMPAKLKGLIDRSFLPGFAFKYEAGQTFQDKLLNGKTAELIFTLDTPVWWYKWWQGNPIYKELKHAILEFSGIKVNRARYFGPIIKSDESQRKAWLGDVSKLGSKPASS